MTLTYRRSYSRAYEFFPGVPREPATIDTYFDTHTGAEYLVIVGTTRALIRNFEHVKNDRSGYAWALTSWQAMDNTARAAVPAILGEPAATLTLDPDTTRRVAYVRHSGPRYWERHYTLTRPEGSPRD
jgi:hypothetical protein